MKRFILAAVFALASCSPGGGYADRSMTPEFVEEAVVRNHDRVTALLGNGTISIETPEIAQNVSFELTLRKPDSVMVRIEGPFGIDLGLALLTREEFFFYNSMSNELITGPTNPENLGRVLRVGIGFDDMLNLFAGGVFLSEDRGLPAAFEIIDDEYVLTYRHRNGSRRYQIDPRNFQIVRISHLDSEGTVLVEQSFARFLTVDGIVLPQLVRVVMRPERRRLSIAFADLSINPATLQFHFDVPPDAERARIQ